MHLVQMRNVAFDNVRINARFYGKKYRTSFNLQVFTKSITSLIKKPTNLRKNESYFVVLDIEYIVGTCQNTSIWRW